MNPAGLFTLFIVAALANRHRGGWLVPGGWYERLKLHRIWETWLVLVAMGHGFSPVAAGVLINCLVRIGWGCPIGRYMKGSHDGKPEFHEKWAKGFFWPRPLLSLAVVGILSGARTAVGGTLIGLVCGVQWAFVWFIPGIYALAVPLSVVIHKHVGEPRWPRSWNGAWNEAYMGILCVALGGVYGFVS